MPPTIAPPTAALSPTIEPLGFRTPTPISVPPTVIFNAPPTIITAAPGTLVAPVTPVEVLTTPEPATGTALPPLPTTTPIAPTPLPTIAPIPQSIPDNPQTRAFALSTSSGVVAGSGFLLPFAATTFARNPSDPNRYAVVDARGLIYLFNGSPSSGSIIALHTSPFAEPEPLIRGTE